MGTNDAFEFGERTFDGTVKPRKADDAYDALKRQIISMQIPPGAPLDERALMAWLGVGRTPLREAIQRLATSQLVVAVPRRGYFVSELSIPDLNEMIAAREMIEPQVARLAARHISDTEVRELRELLDKAIAEADATDVERSVYNDLEIHSRLADASRNRYLAAATMRINTSMLRYWYISFSVVENLTSAIATHERVINPIAAHDEDAAEAAMHEHVNFYKERIRGAVTDGTSFVPTRARFKTRYDYERRIAGGGAW